MLKIKKSQLFPGVLALLLVASTAVSIIRAPSAYADGKDGSAISGELSGQVLDHQLYYFLVSCAARVDVDETKDGEVAKWELFKNGGYYRDSVRGDMYANPEVDCAKGSYIKEAFGRFGFTEPWTTICSLNFIYDEQTGGIGKKGNDGNNGNNAAACLLGKGKDGDIQGVGNTGAQRDGMVKLLKSTDKGKAAAAPLIAAAEYVRKYRTLMNGCKITLKEKITEDSTAANSNGQKFKIPIVNQDGTVEWWLGEAPWSNADSRKMKLVATTSTSDTANITYRTCGQLSKDLQKKNSITAAYATYVVANQADDYTEESGSVSDPGADATTCAVEGIGWIICPVMNFMAKMNDLAFDFLVKLLTIKPELTTSPATAAAWATFRDIANVAFVIAFLIIVYSQLTSVGISNYGIKRLLPKIIIAAILVNISYFICQIAVDISNIVGSSIYQLLRDLVPPPTGGAAEESNWSSIVGTAIGATASLLLFVVIIAAPMVLLALGLILLILIGRQAFILILIVVAPLAFVAYLLPNTEKYFKKWWSAFFATLMVFPIIGAVFGGSSLASGILMNVATDGGGDDETLLKIVALAVLAVPLFAVPALLKGSLSAAGAVGTKLANLQDRVNRKAGADAKDRAGKEVGDLRNRVAGRMLGSESRGARAASFLTGTRRRANREDRYKQNQTKRDSKQEDFLNREIAANIDPETGMLLPNANLSKTSQRRVDATSAAATTKTTGQLLNNAGAQNSMAANGSLYRAVAASDVSTHHAADTLKDQGQTAYYSSPANQGHIAESIAAATERKAAETNATATAKRSDPVRAAVQAQKTAEGEDKIVDDEHERDFQLSEQGTVLSVRKDAVEQEIAAAKSANEGVAIEDNKVVRVQAAAAAKKVAAGKAAESADVKTLTGAKRDEDGNLVDKDGVIVEVQGLTTEQASSFATDLSGADITERVQVQRGNAADSEAAVNYAEALKASDTLIRTAGGIGGSAARQRAVATATQVIDKQLTEAVAAQKTTMESVGTNSLFNTMMDDTLPAEQRAAAAGLLMSRGGDQHVQEVLDYLGTTAPTTAKDVEDLQLLQKQVAADIGARKPQGFGRTDLSRLAEGSYGANGVERDPATNTVIVDAAGNVVKPGDAKGFEDNMVGRLEDGKIGTEEISKMGADELARLAHAITSREGTPKAVPDAVHKALTESIDKLEKDPNLSATIASPEKQEIIDSIRKKTPLPPKRELARPKFDRTN